MKPIESFILSTIVILAVLIFGPGVSAQFYEDFSDPDLMDDVLWEGDVDHFVVASERLQLLAPNAGRSTISTTFTFSDSLDFGASIELDFAPSGDNRLRIYLFHEDESPDSAQALFLELGESGSDDAFHLYYRDSSNTEVELRQFDPIPHGSNLKVTFLASKYEGENWSFAFDHGSNGTIDEQTTLTFGLPMLEQGHFGFECNYTSTRTDKFFFDDVFVQKITPDTRPPEFTAVDVIDQSNLVLTFDEAVDGSVLRVEQFAVQPGDLYPSEVGWEPGSPQEVHLEFDPALANQSVYTLEVFDISDLSGNIADTLTREFHLVIAETAQFGDVIINEVHPAPSPSTQLPNAEFVELLNRSDKVLNLNDFTLSDASTTVSLPEYLFFPGTYVLLTDEDNLSLFPFVDTVVGVLGMPSLNNNGDDISLVAAGVQIDAVSYESSWYEDDNRMSGWSLECVNEESTCRGQINWQTSTDPTGGTPGEINSVFSTDEPQGQPQVERLTVENNETVRLTFNMEMKEEELSKPENYILTPTLDVNDIRVETSEATTVTLSFGESMQSGTIYTLQLSPAVCGCNTESPSNEGVLFGLPEMIMRGDVRISEILYAPYSGESEFIEFTNVSDKVLDVNELWLTYTKTDGDYTQTHLNADILLFPGEYYVFTEDRRSVLQSYEVPYPARVHQFSIPGLTNSGGEMALIVFSSNGDTTIIDQAAYSEDFHDPLLEESNGISLERIQLNGDGLSASNWYSASTLKGGATPTGENSQQIVRPDNQGAEFELLSPTFSPDGDGFEDFMTITYQFDQPGYLATTTVYSYDGEKVKTLTNNESLGTQGQLIWSGETDDEVLAHIGIYYVVIEAFHVNGDVINDKLKVVLARQL